MRTSDAYPDRQHGDRADGILLLQPVRRSVLFRGHGTALSAAREKAHPFYQCDRCPILVYLPMLTISGILTGAFTGLCAWFASRRLRKDQVWFIR